MSVASITARGRARTAALYAERGQLGVVYAVTETVQAGGGLSETWAEVARAYVSFSPAEAVKLGMRGASDMPEGTREMRFVAPMPLLEERQVVDITSGPEAGKRWRVLFVDRSDRVLVLALVEPYDEAQP